ncbi:helix-turn-helix transcriptional regulator [Priestia megaterium]|uniref:Helix-turn-helix transcriptional regulator n=1 Tax=Priestia megaterium TaxID=1404 RepID=A0A6H1P6N2_PRIMG|nr:helix-turn-helix transcriptional regulator [Priestia megaterium]
MEKHSLDRPSLIKYNISRNTEIRIAERRFLAVNDDIAVKVYKALGESTRLQIVKLLAQQSELACLEMANQLKGPANSTLTHHLKPLLDCGLLAVRREGTFRYYSLQREVLAQYAPALL